MNHYAVHLETYIILYVNYTSVNQNNHEETVKGKTINQIASSSRPNRIQARGSTKRPSVPTHCP